MAIKEPKTPRVTRRAKKTAALYKAKPTWAKEDAMGAYRKGGSTRTLRKAQTGETGAPETVSAPTPVEDKPKDKDFVNMSNKEYRAEKKGVKRAKKLKDIESGANRERADKVLNTVGNIASTAANVTNVISDIKNRNNNSGGGGGPEFKKGGFPKMKKMQPGGPTSPNKYVSNKTNMFGNLKHKDISEKKFNRVSDRYSNQKGSENLGTDTSAVQQIVSGKNSNNSVSRVDPVKKAAIENRLTSRKGQFKTGGMVNANAKIAAAKKATGRVGGITKAISKVAVKVASPKGKVGGTSTAPKKALPKAQFGALVKIGKAIPKIVKAGTLSKIAKAPGGKTVIGGTIAGGIAALNKVGSKPKGTKATKSVMSKAFPLMSKSKMGGSTKKKSC